ncbi:MAG TPA: DUF1232 domain-containing protein [Tissierellia bacterium]|nr:DUF1232 domain-containing protein [Tissierellia bacterium]
MDKQTMKQAALKQLTRHSREAKKLLKSPVKAYRLLSRARQKSAKIDIGSFLELRADFLVMIELAKAYIKRDYRQVPVRTILAVLGSALYVLNPIDIIPDVIPVIGYLDDAFVIGFVLKQIRHDLAAFKDWQAGAEAPYYEEEADWDELDDVYVEP